MQKYIPHSVYALGWADTEAKGQNPTGRLHDEFYDTEVVKNWHCDDQHNPLNQSLKDDDGIKHMT